jgi:hypothetical protein
LIEAVLAERIKVKIQLKLMFILLLSATNLVACGKSTFNASEMGSSSNTDTTPPTNNPPSTGEVGGPGGVGSATRNPFRFVSKDAKITVTFSTNYAITKKDLTSIDGAIGANLEVNRTSPTKKFVNY